MKFVKTCRIPSKEALVNSRKTGRKKRTNLSGQIIIFHRPKCSFFTSIEILKISWSTSQISIDFWIIYLNRVSQSVSEIWVENDLLWFRTCGSWNVGYVWICNKQLLKQPQSFCCKVKRSLLNFWSWISHEVLEMF